MKSLYRIDVDVGLFGLNANLSSPGKNDSPGIIRTQNGWSVIIEVDETQSLLGTRINAITEALKMVNND